MIDIIIPVHSAEGNLERTLSSIASQDISEKINVIVVNDASHSLSDLIEIFSNFISIKEIKLDKFSGINIARKVGLENSSNSYVIFMNSNDTFICRNVVKNLYHKIKNTNSDYVYGSVILRREDEFFNESNYNGLQGKIFKRKFFEKNNIDFNTVFYSDCGFFYNIINLYEPKKCDVSTNVVLIDNNISYFLDDVFFYDLDDVIDYISKFTKFISKYLSNEKLYYKYNLSAYTLLIHMYFWYLRNYESEFVNYIISHLNEIIDNVNTHKIEKNLKDEIFRKFYDSHALDFNDVFYEPVCSFSQFLSLVSSFNSCKEEVI